MDRTAAIRLRGDGVDRRAVADLERLAEQLRYERWSRQGDPRKLAVELEQVALRLEALARRDRACELSGQAVELRRLIAFHEPTPADLNALAGSLNTLCLLHLWRGTPQMGLTHAEESVAIRRGLELSNPAYASGLCRSMLNLARSQFALKDPRAADSTARSSVTDAIPFLEHDSVPQLVALSRLSSHMAAFLVGLRMLDPAVKMAHVALRSWERARQVQPGLTETNVLVHALSAFTWTSFWAEDYEIARRLNGRLVAFQQDLERKDPRANSAWNSLYLRSLLLEREGNRRGAYDELTLAVASADRLRRPLRATVARGVAHLHAHSAKRSEGWMAEPIEAS